MATVCSAWAARLPSVLRMAQPLRSIAYASVPPASRRGLGADGGQDRGDDLPSGVHGVDLAWRLVLDQGGPPRYRYNASGL
jgi:hypothetical protein